MRLASVRSLAKLLEKGIGASDWYPEANRSIQAYANGNGLPVGYVADVLALCSPRKTVQDSARIALHYFETGKLIDVTSSVRVQFDHWLATGQIRGPKCEAFSRALMGDSSALVVDTWIGKAMNAPVNSLRSLWLLQAAWNRFKRLADITGLSVSAAQACVWSGIQGGQCAYLTID